MNQELQRIKIAEACGWTEISQRCMWGLPKGAYDTGREDCLKHLPDYLNDLNAMHEAEKVLKGEQWVKYVRLIGGATQEEKGRCHATAAQRSEAFLRTLNLWEE